MDQMTPREIALKNWLGSRDAQYRTEVWSESEVIAAIEEGMRPERERLQAKIDALMLEYCPNEMTPEQIENWKRHQTRAKESK
jgi:hypothetical protein